MWVGCALDEVVLEENKTRDQRCQQEAACESLVRCWASQSLNLQIPARPLDDSPLDLNLQPKQPLDLSWSQSYSGLRREMWEYLAFWYKNDELCAGGRSLTAAFRSV